MNHLANFLTCLSLACGFISIIFSLESHFTFASLAIIFSVIFDGLDGQVAQLNPGPSDFGKELDSLVDVISFGIAPAVLGYTFVYREFHFVATGALFIYLVCSVTRLAKYNITPKEELIKYFTGLPTTASGGVLASFILVFRRFSEKLPPERPIFICLVLILSYLMISKVKYINLEEIKKLFKTSKIAVFGVLIVSLIAFFGFWALSGVFLPEITIFALFALYLISPFLLGKFV